MWVTEDMGACVEVFGMPAITALQQGLPNIATSQMPIMAKLRSEQGQRYVLAGRKPLLIVRATGK
jgi:hypothetical protein